jgi:hypothetical protein
MCSEFKGPTNVLTQDCALSSEAASQGAPSAGQTPLGCITTLDLQLNPVCGCHRPKVQMRNWGSVGCAPWLEVSLPVRGRGSSDQAWLQCCSQLPLGYLRPRAASLLWGTSIQTLNPVRTV